MRITRPVHQQVGLVGEVQPPLGDVAVRGPVEGRRAEPDVVAQVLARIFVDPRCLVTHRDPERVESPHQRGEDVVAAVGEHEPQRRKASEDTLDDERRQVDEGVQRHESRVSRIRVGMAGEGGRIVDTVAAVDVHGDGKVVCRSRFPNRLKHRFAVGLSRLQWNADLHQLRMCGEPFDFGNGPFRVLGVDADRSPEPPGRVGIDPLVQQPIIDGRTDPAVQQIVGDVAPGQRIEDCVVGTMLVKKVPAQRLRVRSRVVIAVEVLPVVAARSLVPLLLNIGDRAQLVRRGQVAPDFGVVAEVGLNVGVDDGAHAVRYTSPSVTSTW